jgi:YlmC/YmxH family sporulation protein
MKFELYDLKQKEVVNMLDGKILGTIEDFEIDDEDGRIISAIIPESSGKLFNFFGKGEEYVIPWSCIKKIGEDTILIELKDTSKYRDIDEDDDD